MDITLYEFNALNEFEKGAALWDYGVHLTERFDVDNYKSSIVKVKPGLQMIANKKLRIYSSPRHIAKPNVIGWRSFVSVNTNKLIPFFIVRVITNKN